MSTQVIGTTGDNGAGRSASQGPVLEVRNLSVDFGVDKKWVPAAIDLNYEVNAGEVLAIVRRLAEQGTTMVLATHEMSFAREVATTVCFLHQGRILEQGPPEQILTAPREERTRQFLRRVLPG